MKWQLIFSIMFLPFVSALCEDGQIDVNSASLGELDVLKGIGPAKAQAIVDSRPFNSVDDLIDVSGIGPVTLGKIKDQGLACVDSEEKTITEEEAIEEDIVEETTPVEEESAKEPVDLKLIELNPTLHEFKV